MTKRGRPAGSGKKGGFDIVTGLSAVVIVFLLYLVIKRVIKIIQQNKQNRVADVPVNQENPLISTTPIPVPSESLDVDKWLKRGSRGNEVKELQKLMNKDIDRINSGRNKVYAGTFIPAYPKLVVDGIFGQKTEAALIEITSLNLGAGKGVKETSIRRYKSIVAMPNK